MIKKALLDVSWDIFILFCGIGLCIVIPFLLAWLGMFINVGFSIVFFCSGLLLDIIVFTFTASLAESVDDWVSNYKKERRELNE